MTFLLKTTSIAIMASLAFGANNLSASVPTYTADQEMPAVTTTEIAPVTTIEASIPELKAPMSEIRPSFDISATIGFARLDKGRLIYAPAVEMRDWGFLDKRSNASFAQVTPAALIKNLPEIPMNGRDTDNKIDEIRMTASDLGMNYIVIYGMGSDAQWGSFAGKTMAETGLTVSSDNIAPRGDAKALLVNTYTGEILGTLTSNMVEFTIGDLTDQVEVLINELSSDAVTQDA